MSRAARSRSPQIGNLVFIGFMGAGKTSAARSVAAELGVRAIDADAAIERHLGASIEDWFARHGEQAFRQTNRSGGVEGGMSTGEPLVVRCAMKPLPTLTKPLRSVDIATREPAEALRERTDSCTVPAAGVVGEAMLAIVLAGAYREKFGGDHIDDVRAALAAYEERIGWKRRR